MPFEMEVAPLISVLYILSSQSTIVNVKDFQLLHLFILWAMQHICIEYNFNFRQAIYNTSLIDSTGWRASWFLSNSDWYQRLEEKWKLGTKILWEREEGDVCLSVGLKGRLWRKRLMGGVTRCLWSFQQHSQMFGGMEKQPHPYTHKRQKDHQRRTLFPGIYFRNLIELNQKNILRGILFQISLRPPTNSQKASKERASPLKGASTKYVIQTCTICFWFSFDLWFEETFKIYNVWFLLSRGQMLISRWFSWFLPKYCFWFVFRLGCAKTLIKWWQDFRGSLICVPNRYNHWKIIEFYSQQFLPPLWGLYFILVLQGLYFILLNVSLFCGRDGLLQKSPKSGIRRGSSSDETNEIANLETWKLNLNGAATQCSKERRWFQGRWKQSRRSVFVKFDPLIVR